MRLRLLTERLLDAPEDFDCLAQVIYTIVDGWHNWFYPDPDDVELQIYFKQNPTHRELVDKSYAAALAYSVADSRTVTIVNNDHSARPEADIYPIRRAPYFLRQVLEILVENEINDGKFFQRFLRAVDPDLADSFDAQPAPVKFCQGGGKTELPRLVRHRTAQLHDQQLRARLLVIADSDAKFPGHTPSDTSELLRACAETNVPVYVLQKRAIENYVPDRIVELYKAANPDVVDSARFILQLSVLQRDHYPIRKGLETKTTQQEQTLYVGLSCRIVSWPKLPKLMNFFLSDSQHAVTEADLASRSCLDELRSLAALIRAEL